MKTLQKIRNFDRKLGSTELYKQTNNILNWILLLSVPVLIIVRLYAS